MVVNAKLMTVGFVVVRGEYTNMECTVYCYQGLGMQHYRDHANRAEKKITRLAYDNVYLCRCISTFEHSKNSIIISYGNV